jgi:predicted ATPase
MHLTAVNFHPERYPTVARYPFSLPLVRETSTLAIAKPITILVGANGSGKSTLLRAIAQRAGIHIWQYEGGRRIEHNPYEERLADYLDVEWREGPVPGAYFASDLFRDFAQLLEEWAANDPGMLRHFGGHSLLTLSHGQSLMAYFEGRYRIRGLYFLDEPETALTPRRQLELAALIAQMACAGHAQFLMATHSPLLMACEGAALLSVDRVPIAPIDCRATEHYQTWRDFILARERGD